MFLIAFSRLLAVRSTDIIGSTEKDQVISPISVHDRAFFIGILADLLNCKYEKNLCVLLEKNI